MYAVGRHDRVVELADLPQSCVGAPSPVIIGDEGTVSVAYRLSGPESVRLVQAREGVCIVQFQGCRAQYAGSPNDEALHGHPLWKCGLEPYGAFEVMNSSWIRELARRNRVHPRHREEHFDALRHIVLTFHDSLFECIAAGYDVHHLPGAISRAIPEIVTRQFDLRFA
ncbi:MAG: hypothetical protein KDA21_00800 [Phycisphaerales bacterium]|nr:hypothetical protein [Phycisphaerales bacterium]